ncbi:MAG: DEAD/DEAH box helicase [Anaerolineae bacterium]
MSDNNVVLTQAVLDDSTLAHELATRVSEEDAQLDFTHVERVTSEFAEVMCKAIVAVRSPAVLSNALLVHTMRPDVQQAFMPAIMSALSEGVKPAPGAKSAPGTQPPPEPSRAGTSQDLSPRPSETVSFPVTVRPPVTAVDPFKILEHVRADYRTYVETFQRFQDPAIRDWVMERIQNGTLLWKPPYIQLSRPFASGESLPALVDGGLLHPGVLRVFRRDLDDPESPPIAPYRHQTEAVRAILGDAGMGYGDSAGANVVVATGTGSGKSFAFGIPIVSQALRDRDRGGPGTRGIKAVIVYPMNALANSQYDDFAARLHGSGLTIARYTGDTPSSEGEALDQHKRATGRETPYDSEILSRERIQTQPPDILMTNYVMLELLLTRFEDRKLFAAPGVLKFLVLDEVHTYTGKRGADVAALIRRLKQHTGTTGKLRCIATSATVESTGETSAGEAVADFATKLSGEPFDAANVVTESYAPWPADLDPDVHRLADALTGGPLALPDLADGAQMTPEEVAATLLKQQGDRDGDDEHRLALKLHAFFSQGRAISACLDPRDPHLNDRGERVCPVCAEAGRPGVPTFPLVFCRACGQEYWSVAVDEEDRLHPAELDAVDLLGKAGYLMRGHEEIELPDHWRTKTGKVRGGKHGYQDVVPSPMYVCPDCGQLLSDLPYRGSLISPGRQDGEGRDDSRPVCTHPRAFPVTFLPAPFLLCPSCGIVHDRRSREYNKLFTFGSVGRSTATDVLVSAQVQSLPAEANKVIAFSDNRQDTALQAAHMNSLHRRFTFRQTLYTALKEAGHIWGNGEGLRLQEVGNLLFEGQQRHHVLPNFRKSTSKFKRDAKAEQRYRDYLSFVGLWELGATHRRTHQNLEDVGLLAVGYAGLPDVAADEDWWADVPEMASLPVDIRYDLLLGLMDILRKRLALPYSPILEPLKFARDILGNLNEEAFIHDDTFRGPIGYSDSAPNRFPLTVYRLTTSANTQPMVWLRRVFDAIGEPVDFESAQRLLGRIVEKLGDPRAEFLVRRTASPYRTRRRFDLWMLSPDVLLWADQASEHWRCPKCGTVHRFRTLRVCTGSTCRTTLEERDLTDNYFRKVYATPLGQAMPVTAEEHSGQVGGRERREIEIRFRDPEDPLNVLVCTPTMELGIDIGHLNAVTLRNVPPSPSNYAQRAGRAGRSGQAALISVFAGVGSARGPHDQYFYRFPEKMIAGAIAAPRFRLDNEALLTSHIHALVLETLGLLGAQRLPGKPQDLLDHSRPDAHYPLFADWRAAYQQGIETHFARIVEAVESAFAAEMVRFAWLDRPFIEEVIRGFVPTLDLKMERWRTEYERLDAEREAINVTLGSEHVDPSLSRRRDVIERKLQRMREGHGDWYLYRYLGGEGFLPGYAFPPQATILSFNDREDELARDPEIALGEYAPGNFVYYRGEQYAVTHARPRRRRVYDESGKGEMELDIEPVQICPECQRAYVGQAEVGRARCDCGADLTIVHGQKAMGMVDMYAQARARITADEEERRRRGYVTSSHYRAGGEQQAYTVSRRRLEAFRMTLEHNGEVLRINQGPPDAEGRPEGFTLCRKCHAWLLGDNAPDKHVYTPQAQGECPRHAGPEDLERGLWLTTSIRSDLALFDVPLPEGVPLDQAESFYVTLTHTLLRALLVAFNLDERELNGFLAPVPQDAETEQVIRYRIVLYETTVGGSGVLASLSEPGRLMTTVDRARELLHEGDPEGGCEQACYACLLSFYNQRVHELLDRTLVLPWLQSLADLSVDAVVSEDRFGALVEQCGSDLERQVLMAIRDRALPLPDEAQKVIYDGDEPLVIADFYYEPRIVVFVDGSPHYRDYVQAADARKRRRLKALGYRVVVVRAEDPDTGLDELAAKLT